MLYALKGKILTINKKSLIVETTDFDYEIFVSNPNDFCINEYVHLFLHHVIKEDDEYVIGFKTIEEKNAFELLLNVQGIGPKSAINILSNVDFNDLLIAISNNDIDFINNINGINSRTASQILLDLNNYIIKKNKENNTLYIEIKNALKKLKFKSKDIDRILPKIYIPNATKEELIKEALRRLKNYEQCS